jgi:hypothetical protein
VLVIGRVSTVNGGVLSASIALGKAVSVGRGGNNGYRRGISSLGEFGIYLIWLYCYDTCHDD